MRAAMIPNDVMVSYAQNGEDVVLSRVFRDLNSPGFYIDVGACDPVEDSVTLHFYERGWHGINIEPDAYLHASLMQARPRDVNVLAALGHQRGRATFHAARIRGHGTLDAKLAEQRPGDANSKVPMLTLADVIDYHGPDDGEIAFLKVDVEGWEAQVLASADWRRHRPVIVLVEAVGEDGNPTHEEWEPGLLAGGYRFAQFDGLNRYYVREEDADRLLPRLAPANVLDRWRRAGEVRLVQQLERLDRERLATALRADALGADAEEARHATIVAERLRDEMAEKACVATITAAQLRDEMAALKSQLEAKLQRAEEARADAAGFRDVLGAETQRLREAAAAAFKREEAAEQRLAELEMTAVLGRQIIAELEAKVHLGRHSSAELDLLRDKVDNLVMERTTLMVERTELLNRVLQQAAEIAAFRTSTSWRLSYPVRLAGRRLKRLRGRNA